MHAVAITRLPATERARRIWVAPKEQLLGALLEENLQSSRVNAAKEVLLRKDADPLVARSRRLSCDHHHHKRQNLANGRDQNPNGDRGAPRLPH